MFYFYRKKEVSPKHVIKIRDEWGQLHIVKTDAASPRLSDKELAEQLETNQATVETHRRD